MRKLQRIALAAALAAAGLGVVGFTENAATAAPEHSTQAAATASSGGGGSVRANERVVEAFLQDVINEHHGDDAASYLNPGMQWSGGTVGTVTGRANVAGLFASVVAAFPDAHIVIDDIFGQGDQVVVRVVVSGTQKAPFSASPRAGALSSGTASTSTA